MIIKLPNAYNSAKIKNTNAVFFFFLILKITAKINNKIGGSINIIIIKSIIGTGLNCIVIYLFRINLPTTHTTIA